jgi:hypothetical protein
MLMPSAAPTQLKMASNTFRLPSDALKPSVRKSFSMRAGCERVIV